MKMARIDNKRTSNNSSGAVYTSAITTQKYIQCFEMKRRGGAESWKEDEKASWTSVFSLMLIIYVVCAFYYYYLFIYYFLFSSLPVFQRHHGQGSRIKLLSLVSKGFLRVFIYIFLLLYTCLVVIWWGKHMKLWWEANLTCILLYWPPRKSK